MTAISLAKLKFANLKEKDTLKTISELNARSQYHIWLLSLNSLSGHIQVCLRRMSIILAFYALNF